VRPQKRHHLDDGHLEVGFDGSADGARDAGRGRTGPNVAAGESERRAQAGDDQDRHRCHEPERKGEWTPGPHQSESNRCGDPGPSASLAETSHRARDLAPFLPQGSLSHEQRQVPARCDRCPDPPGGSADQTANRKQLGRGRHVVVLAGQEKQRGFDG
jgi:hypothetical protein